MGQMGEIIKRWRLEKGLRQEDIEAMSKGDVSQAYLSDLERGKMKRPSLLKMRVLVAILGHDLEELFSEDGHQDRRLPAMVA